MKGHTFHYNVSLSSILHDSLCINYSKADPVAWGQSIHQDNLISPSAGFSTLPMLLWFEHITVKVKLSLCTSYKAYGSGVRAPLSLILSTRRRSIVSFMPRLVYTPPSPPKKRASGVCWREGCVGPTVNLDALKKETKSLASVKN